MPSHLHPILAADIVTDLIAICDTTLYKAITNVYITDPLQSIPDKWAHAHTHTHTHIHTHTHTRTIITTRTFKTEIFNLCESLFYTHVHNKSPEKKHILADTPVQCSTTVCSCSLVWLKRCTCLLVTWRSGWRVPSRGCQTLSRQSNTRVSR